MRPDPVIEFAQRLFGSDARFGEDAAAGVTLPDWLAGQIGEVTGIEPADQIRIEGEAPKNRPLRTAANGTTADDLAYYLPFHFYKRTWGIYIRASGLVALAKRISHRVGPRSLAAAYSVLIEHERLHFAAEYAASRVEVITGASCYREYFARMPAKEHEEALANAYALIKLRRHASNKAVASIAEWMRRQAAGYRDFEACMPPLLTEAERRATKFMTIVAAVMNDFSGADCHPAEFLFRSSPQRVVPVYWLLDASIPWLRLVRPFPKDFGIQVLVHSNDHKPPHIHIQAPPGRDRTRYQWPKLSPLRGDPFLSRKERKNLDQYVAVYGQSIDERVKAIPWR